MLPPPQLIRRPPQRGVCLDLGIVDQPGGQAWTLRRRAAEQLPATKFVIGGAPSANCPGFEAKNMFRKYETAVDGCLALCHGSTEATQEVYFYFFNFLLEVVAKERFPRQCPQPPDMQPPVLKRGH